jgi:hypothetical protein
MRKETIRAIEQLMECLELETHCNEIVNTYTCLELPYSEFNPRVKIVPMDIGIKSGRMVMVSIETEWPCILKQQEAK